jgi:hypothetical protein
MLLGTSTTILSLWEERFGYPVPERCANGQRLYADDAVIALQDALGRELSISSAITEARRAQLRPRTDRFGFTRRSEPPEEAP